MNTTSPSFTNIAPDWPLSDDATAALVGLCLGEDIGSGDVTSEAIFGEQDTLKAVMRAREPMTVSGLAFAASSFWAMNKDIKIDFCVTDGHSVQTGEAILYLEGSARALLSAERTALNMVQHLSGISTLVARYVKLLQGTNTTLLDTRKTTPGLRHVEKYAVRMGGGTNHRMGLYDAIMIKDNHIAAAGSISEAIKRAKISSKLPIQVECDTLDQALDALKAGADSLLLDNMSPNTLKSVIDKIGNTISIEASGGISLETLADYAASDVTYISVGRLTSSAPNVDIGLDFYMPD